MDLFGNDIGAKFSEDRKHRFALWRIWDNTRPLIMFIGLNPSKANEKDSDRTVTRVRNLAIKWGYGGFYMMNLFSYVSTNPEELVICTDNTENDSWLHQVREKCKEVVFVWGNFSIAKKRAKQVESMFEDAKALLLNKNGSPRHPLYVPGNIELINFEYGKNTVVNKR